MQLSLWFHCLLLIQEKCVSHDKEHLSVTCIRTNYADHSKGNSNFFGISAEFF